MIEFSLLLISLAKEFVGLLKVCAECFLAYIALKKFFYEKHKKGKPSSTNSRKRTGSNDVNPFIWRNLIKINKENLYGLTSIL